MSEQAFFRSMRLHHLSLFVNKKISKQALSSGTLSVFGLEGKRKKRGNETLQLLVEKSTGSPKTGGSSWEEEIFIRRSRKYFLDGICE